MPSKFHPSKVPTRPAPPQESYASLSHRHGHSKTNQSGLNSERHVRNPSIGQASVTSCRSNDSTGSKTLWDEGDTFLPRAKPPPPLPMLEKHRHTRSQHRIQSPLAQPLTSMDLSLYDLPVLDISRRYQADDPPRAQTPLTRSNSGVSDEFISKQWKPPPSWAGPHACVRDDVKAPRPARSLPRLGSRSRAQSNPQGQRGAAPTKSKAPEREAIRLVDIVGSGEHADVRDEGIIGSRPSTGVKIQCYEGWHEKPVEDVIHMLRELRFK